MSDSFIPNTFQTPNAIIDRLMFLLTDGEFRVLMYAVRHILGWKHKAKTLRGCISLSSFVDGFSYDTPNGVVSYPGCGLGLNPVRNALKGLQKYRILEAIGDPTAKGQEWELRFMVHDDIDIPGLKLRQENQNQRRKKQTSEARKVSPKNTGVSVQQIEQEGICSTDSDPISSTDSQGICSTDNNEIPSKDHSKDQKDSAPIVAVTLVKPEKLSAEDHALFMDILHKQLQLPSGVAWDVYHQLRGSGKDKTAKRYKHGVMFREKPVTLAELKTYVPFYRKHVTDTTIPIPTSAEGLETWFNKLRAAPMPQPVPVHPSHVPFVAPIPISDEDRAAALAVMKKPEIKSRKGLGYDNTQAAG